MMAIRMLSNLSEYLHALFWPISKGFWRTFEWCKSPVGPTLPHFLGLFNAIHLCTRMRDFYSGSPLFQRINKRWDSMGDQTGKFIAELSQCRIDQQGWSRERVELSEWVLQQHDQQRPHIAHGMKFSFPGNANDKV